MNIKKKKSCVYEIVNTKTGKRYIGSTTNFYSRRSRHLYNLRRGIHKNHPLQKDFNLYGENVFDFNVLKFAKPSRLKHIEQEYMEMYRDLYNLQNALSLDKIQTRNEEIRFSIEIDAEPPLIDDYDWEMIKEFNPDLF